MNIHKLCYATREFNSTLKFEHASSTVMNDIFMCSVVVSSGSVLMSGLTGLGDCKNSYGEL